MVVVTNDERCLIQNLQKVEKRAIFNSHCSTRAVNC